MEKGWRGLPYNTISSFYQQRFGEKIYKIPVSVVDDCPNRRGLKGMQTCVFCDVWGSAARSEAQDMELSKQISDFGKHLGDRYHAKNFLVYFQAYTNSFTKISSLKNNFETSLAFPFVKGFVVGTRPDCLSPAVLNLWQEYHEKSFVSVELGVQSFFDDQLQFMRRGHSAQQSLDAIAKISLSTNVDLGIHLMFGQPGETDQQIIQTAELVNTLPITNIKLHNLHVLTNTPLEKMFLEGHFKPIERPLYAHRVQLFLEHLSPRFFLHRLAALAPRRNELVAPTWTSDKMGTHQYIIDHLRSQGSYQGRHFKAVTAEEQLGQKNFFLNSQPFSGL